MTVQEFKPLPHHHFPAPFMEFGKAMSKVDNSGRIYSPSITVITEENKGIATCTKMHKF